MASEKLRQAIAAALDIKQLVMLASEGMAAINGSAVPLGSAYYNEAQRRNHVHDLAVARRLLNEAGYKGQKITIQANERANVPSLSIARRAAAMLQLAGINAQVEVLDWKVHLDRYNKGEFQISSFTYSSRLDPGLSYEQLVGDKKSEPQKVWGDPRARQLVDASLVEVNEKKRQAMFDEMHNLMLQQVPLILLYNGVDTWAVQRWVSGFSVWEGKPRVWNTQVLARQSGK